MIEGGEEDYDAYDLDASILSMDEALALRSYLGIEAIDEEAAQALREAFEQKYPIEAGLFVPAQRFQGWWEQEENERAPEIQAALAQLGGYLSAQTSHTPKELSSLDWSNGALSAVLSAVFRPEERTDDEKETDEGLSEKESELRRALAKKGIIVDF